MFILLMFCKYLDIPVDMRWILLIKVSLIWTEILDLKFWHLDMARQLH
jgi:hypothetical protein